MSSYSCDEIDIEAMINALVWLLVEFVILFLIYFWLIGRNTNLEASGLFFIIFYAVTVFVVPAQVQNELIAKYADDWLSQDSSFSTLDSKRYLSVMPNVWLLLVPFSLPLAVGGVFSICLYNSYLSSFAWIAVAILIVVSLMTVLPLVVWLNRKYLYSVYKLISLNGGVCKENKESLGYYYFTRHIIPWAPVTFITACLILYKMTEEMIFSDGMLPTVSSAFFVGSTCYVACAWMAYESGLQAKTDIKLGVFVLEKENPISISNLIFLIHAVSAVAVGLALALGYFFGKEGFSQVWLISLGAVLVMICGLIGNFLGVTWALGENK